MKEYSKDFLRQLYRTMLGIRVCEESLVEPILNGDVQCPVHLCSGEEAVAVGVCAALEDTDSVFGNHRSHEHFIAKGGRIDALASHIRRVAKSAEVGISFFFSAERTEKKKNNLLKAVKSSGRL